MAEGPSPDRESPPDPPEELEILAGGGRGDARIGVLMSMRFLAALPVLAACAALVSCACNCYDAPEEDPVPEPYVREEETHRVEPEGSPLQYMAFCVEEKRALSRWVGSEGDAGSAARDHLDKHPLHEAYVLWRQTPGSGTLKVSPPRASD